MTRYPYRTLQALSLLLPLYAGPALAVEEGDTTTVTISGTLVDAPECTVNGNNIVDVNFGDSVVTRLIDGVNYRKEIPVTLNCNNPVKYDMTLSIRAARDAGFGSGLVGTDVEGLGIQLYSGSVMLKAGDPVNFVYPSVPGLSAVLVAEDNATLTSRTFSGTGTLVINYQ
ncbi:hypothetical protein DAI21_22755 (plasmid) [Lelliottia sp. WB101]|jgi:type 1 fimbria pilin|uniref:fimbrial protein n=1 Tax=Lelliottia sp. WB101 TaxID=2153385 RepID=UPI000D21BC9D|nr:fimbrial protein [Lelliottia sp. WB101]AVZ00440.1 hypothetical protein DAI21_22755 [Lelliottia sp. WB101]